MVWMKDLPEIANIKFSISTEPAVAQKADLLVVFMDQSLDIGSNDHFADHPTQSRRLHEYAHAYL
jgi:hypothetical protein